MPPNTISYANPSPALGVEHIIYNIPNDDVKEFNLKFDTYLKEGEEFSGYDSDFKYIQGCYNLNAIIQEDQCLCDDVDEILILQCIQNNF